MANFFKRKNGNGKTVLPVERPRFFKQTRESSPQDEELKSSSGILADKLFLFFGCLWILGIVLSAIYSIFNFANLPNQIPLFYSQVWGESQLASKSLIFLPCLGSLVLGLFNFVFAFLFHQNNRVFSYLLIGTATLLSVMSAITTFNIINLIR